MLSPYLIERNAPTLGVDSFFSSMTTNMVVYGVKEGNQQPEAYYTLKHLDYL